MANTKITELTAVTALAGTDVFPVVDVSASTTNKVSVSDLLRNAPDGAADAPSIANAGDQDTGIFFPAANSVGVSTAGVQQLVIDSSGNVGIGTTSPSDYGNFADDLVIYNSSQPGITLATGASGYGSIYFADGTAGNAASRGQIQYNHSNDSLLFATAASERLHIDSSGVIKHTGSTGSDETNKLARYVVPSHDTNEEDVLVFQVENESSFNQISFGGGTSSYNAATQIVFRTASAVDTTTGSERMRINSSGNVGIGTTSPSTKFVVSNGGAEGVEFSHASGTNEINSYNRSSSARAPVDIIGQTFKVLTGNPSLSTGLFQDSSGRVLVGATSAAIGSKMDVHAGSDGANIFGVTGADQSSEFLALGVTSSEAVLTAGNASSNGTSLVLRTANSSGVESERMRIDSSGNVLVGTTTASGNMTVNMGTDKNISFNGNQGEVGNVPALVATNNAGSSLASMGFRGTDLRFATGSTERMRVDGNGQALFYSTGNPITSGTSQSAGTTHEVFTGVHSRSSTTSGGTVCIHIFSNGNIQNTNNSYGQISDVKLKENIVNANSQWDDIKDIQVRNFNFKEETGNPTHTQIGVVAQELETVSPGLVYEMPDTDDEGNNLGTVTKSVNYSVLYMKAVKALQEAMDRIETLETKVAALEAQ